MLKLGENEKALLVLSKGTFFPPWTPWTDLPGMHWDVFRVFAYGLQQAQGPKLFLYTPWKFNIAPEKLSSQKESSFPTIIFQGLC